MKGEKVGENCMMNEQNTEDLLSVPGNGLQVQKWVRRYPVRPVFCVHSLILLATNVYARWIFPFNVITDSNPLTNHGQLKRT